MSLLKRPGLGKLKWKAGCRLNAVGAGAPLLHEDDILLSIH